MPPADEKVSFTGPVYDWTLGDAEHPRRFTVITVTFGQLAQWFFTKAYDFRSGKGFQREQVDSHVRKLLRDMKGDAYTPAACAAGLLPSHEKSLAFSERGGIPHVTITPTKNSLIPLTDGGHRRRALETAQFEAKAAGDAARVAEIERQPLPVVVLLDSSRLSEDFENYQKGRAPDRNTLRGMQRHRSKDPLAAVAEKVIIELSENPQSHLCNQVQFDSTARRPIQYNSVTAEKSSDLFSSVYGGARISSAYKRTPEWLASCYVAAWQALLTHLPKRREKLPDLMQPGQVLCPTLYGGKRGASHFIVGVGNILAFRLAQQDKPAASSEELKRIGEVVQHLFAQPGAVVWSGGDKRQLGGEFTRLYMADMVGAGKLPDREGVPEKLVELLSPSAFNIGKRGGVVKADEEAVSQLGLFDEAGLVADEPPPSPPRRAPRRRIATGSQV